MVELSKVVDCIEKKAVSASARGKQSKGQTPKRQKRSAGSVAPASGSRQEPRRARLERAPTRAAVALTLETPTEAAYAEVIAAAKTHVRLEDHGIAAVVVERAMTGGLLLEIAGPEMEKKAESLAAVLRPALRDKAVWVRRPSEMGGG